MVAMGWFSVLLQASSTTISSLTLGLKGTYVASSAGFIGVRHSWSGTDHDAPARRVAGVDRGDRPALLEVRNVSKSFGGVEVLVDTSFDIKAADFIVLRGANGSGKTTLLNILSGLLRPDSGAIMLYRNGVVIDGFHFGERGRSSGRFSLMALARAGVLRSWQGIRLFSSLSLLDNLNVAVPTQMGERLLPALFRRRAVHDRERSVSVASLQMLSSFGLDSLVGNGGDHLSAVRADHDAGRVATGAGVSLGEAKRVALARACRGDSRILLLDEPLSGLDARGIRSVIQLLRVLNREHGIAMLVVEHESTVKHLSDLASEVWALEGGRVAHDRAGTDAAPEAAFVARWRYAVTRGGEVARTAALPRGARISVIAPPDGPTQAEGLAVRGLCIVRAGRPVLPPLSFTVPRGAVAILEAPNGWGKTSLVEAVGGLLPVQSGEVIMDGVHLNENDACHRRRRGLTLLQSRGTSFPKLKVREALEVSRVRLPPPYLDAVLHRTISSLSGGERQRLLFACSQGGDDVRLNLWDEPFSGLDASGIDLLTEAVRRRPADQTYLIVLPASAQDIHDEQLEEP